MAERLAGFGYWRLDVSSNAIFWSDEVYHVHGLDPAAGPPDLDAALDAYIPEDRPKVESGVRRCIESGQPFELSLRIRRPDGGVRNVVARGTPEFGPDGEVAAIIGVFLDISRRQDVERTQRVNELLRQTIDALDEAVSIYDPDDRYVYANPKYFELFPYLKEIEDLEGKTFEEVLRISLKNRIIDSPLALNDPETYVAERLRARKAGVSSLGERRHKSGRWYSAREFRTETGAMITMRRDITEDRAAGEELEKIKERYELAVFAGGIGVWEYYKNSGSFFWSDFAADILTGGLEQPPDDMNAMSAIVHPEDLGRFKGQFRACVSHRATMDIEVRIRSRDGRYNWVHWRARAIKDEGGGVERMVGSIVDTTRRKLDQERVARSEARLRDIARTVPGVLCQWSLDEDKQPLFTYVSPKAQEIFGFEDSSPMGVTANLIAIDEDLPIVRNALERELRTGDLIRFEARYALPLRGIRWIRNMSQVVSVSKDRTDLTGVLVDVTEIKEAQERIEESERRLNDAIEAIDEAFAYYDSQDRLVIFNDTYRNLRPEVAEFVAPGLRFEDYLRLLHKHDLLPREVEDPERWIRERMEWHRSPGEDPILVSVPDGRVFLIAERPSRDGGTVSTVTDVTDLKRRETALEIAHARLSEQNDALEKLAADLDTARLAAEAANEAKSQFLAMMSHEIRTPMTGLLGMVEMLRGEKLNKSQRGYLDVLGQCANTLQNLLNDILDLSKIEAGQLKLESIAFDLARTAQETVDLFQSAAAEKGLRLLVSVDEHTAREVRGDPLRFKQILANLISNAVKFTTDGKVELRLGSSLEGDVLIVRGSVSDTGMGIPEEALPRLFNQFDQVDTSTTRKFGGTGLGLAICQRLVDAMDGSISVVSEVGKGSTFSFELRFGIVESRQASAGSEASGSEEESTPSADPGNTPDLRILLAEDNSLNADLIVLMLAKWGHKTEIAPNGLEAVRKAEETPYDLILMDMQMPELDGPEATREIRGGDGPNRNAAIVGLSADAMPEHRRKYMEAGLTDFETKPVDWPRLRSLIASLHDRGLMPNAGEN
ncbi:PAS domain-containing protein [Nisaea sp.]|uniref:PAS domain-containing protein n=1 Tax=Nisaea sp. TaxID=2024842 RepID=UPI003B52AAEF